MTPSRFFKVREPNPRKTGATRLIGAISHLYLVIVTCKIWYMGDTHYEDAAPVGVWLMQTLPLSRL